MLAPAPKRKLIEVGLPLLEINDACKDDKARTHGTVRNIHKWFAPMPFPAWRALLFAALVDDPGDEERRLYLLDVIRRLVKNGGGVPDPRDLREAQLILQAQFPEGVPTVMDPFCGGGSTLVEGQRLGLPTLGSDLNPVPVLISRTLTETLPRVLHARPLHPEAATSTRSGGRGRVVAREDQALFTPDTSRPTYVGYSGLISDVMYYAELIRDRVAASTAQWFPSTPGETPIFWLWARTVACPSPACRAQTILTTSWLLSKMKGDLAWINPLVAGNHIDLEVVSNQRVAKAPPGPKVGRGDFACVCCAASIKADYLKTEGQAGRLGVRMIAVATERDGHRFYRAPRSNEIEAAAACPRPELSLPDIEGSTQYIGGRLYGLTNWTDQYAPRQLTVLAAFAEEIRGLPGEVLKDGGSPDYAMALVTYFGLALGRLASANSVQARLRLSDRQQSKIEGAFGRADLPMMWDFAEAAVFGGSVGDWMAAARKGTKVLPLLPEPAHEGFVVRADARDVAGKKSCLVATDPPYFDAIGYADLSDYFYIWHRLALKDALPELYASIATPKVGELTAISAHHDGDADVAKAYFIDGFTKAFGNLKNSMAHDTPCIVVYASKEQKDAGSEQTRWASVLTSMISAGLEISGTWPIHGTGGTRMRGMESNAVATYIAMVARLRPDEAQPVSWTDFSRELRTELPRAIHDLQVSAVLPVDVPQAVIGPGMRIFSRYPAVLRGAGASATVDEAIGEINRVREEIMDAAEGELDRESQCALAFWGRHGWAEAPFGDADEVVRPRGRTVQDLVRAQVLVADQGRASVLGEVGTLERTWNPASDAVPTAWEGLHHLADRLAAADLGVPGAAPLYAQLQQQGLANATRALAYRMAGLSAQLGRGTDEQRYNDVIEAWPLLVMAVSEPMSEGLF